MSTLAIFNIKIITCLFDRRKNVHILQGSVQATELNRVEGVPFIKHQCGVNCLADPRYQYNENKMLGTNPLLIPLGIYTLYAININIRII